jgi:predicted DNA-binding transcriptional regulator YafY
MNSWYNGIMRADRLISLLMLLQTRGRMTAQDLATELEVSERTIYRDIEALSASGVPVYAESGPGGGCSLVDHYRTTLNGLNADEVRALFTLSVPAPLDALGMSQPLKAALLKLSAALPAVQRNGEAIGVRQRVYLDATPWGATLDEATPHLQTVLRAVWQDRKLRMVRHVYFAGFIDTQLEHLVAPLGLIAKEGVWHVACSCEGRMQVFRVAHLTSVEMLNETFERPATFDLVTFWEEWCDAVERGRARFDATVRIAPHMLDHLPQYLGRRVQVTSLQPDRPDPSGRQTLCLTFETLNEARERLLALGGMVEVLDPPELRWSIADYARQIVRIYSPRSHEDTEVNE